MLGDSVRGLSGLEMLTLAGCGLPEAELLLSARRFPELRSLVIDSAGQRGPGTLSCAQHPAIESVRLGGGGGGGGGGGPEPVESLVLQHCAALRSVQLSPAALAVLVRLDLSFCNMLPGGALRGRQGGPFGAPGAAPALRVVKLSQCTKLTDGDLLSLAGAWPPPNGPSN